MTNQLDPISYGLSKRTILQSDGDDIVIVKQRKTRIIMKDSQQIMDIANKIRENNNKAQIKLLISGPICSKSIKFLSEGGINIIQ